jgi:hypothetical protein
VQTRLPQNAHERQTRLPARAPAAFLGDAARGDWRSPAGTRLPCASRLQTPLQLYPARRQEEEDRDRRDGGENRPRMRRRRDPRDFLTLCLPAVDFDASSPDIARGDAAMPSSPPSDAAVAASLLDDGRREGGWSEGERTVGAVHVEERKEKASDSPRMRLMRSPTAKCRW